MAPGIAEKKNNSLPLWGNEKTMNLNNLILTNILSSHYFKNNLYQLKTYHEVIDEIYYQVTHLEPWEKGSRKTSGQTGMCGGVRGVGAGGIVSTAFCILYKLFTLKLTRKQVVGLINHSDSPYIRGLGFMYIRYTQPPGDLYEWFENYLSDEEELDVKAGGGQVMTIGEMLRHFLSKLEWFSTLFPRIPVPIQKDLERKLSSWRSRPENRALVESSEWKETNDQPSRVSDDWTERSVPVSDTQSKDNSNSRSSHVKSSEEASREKDRHSSKKDRAPGSHHHHHATDHHKNHGSHKERSKSPRRSDSKQSRDEELKRSKKRHHERDRSSDRNHKVKRHHESPERRYSKERNYDHDRKLERRHDHSHRHDHSKHERKDHSHSRNHH